MNPLETVLGLLQSWDRWILVSHEKPDGDTLGCGSALCALAHRLGRDVRWWGRDPLPSLYGFLPRAERYETPVSAATSWEVGRWSRARKLRRAASTRSRVS